MTTERFELELLGGNTELRYRRLRPEVEAMPWGTLRPGELSADERVRAQVLWTSAAFQEYRTAVACAATLRALMEAHAPLDLVAQASRFPLDEIVHVELCSRMAMELGGGSEILFDPNEIVDVPGVAGTPLLRAADCVVRVFCVGEALSIPLLRATWKSARHPLPRAVLGRIVKDEAAHGVFGFTFLDWALPSLGEEEKLVLGRAADRGIAAVHELWRSLESQPRTPSHGDYLGWMGTSAYLELARRSLQSQVIEPLQARGIPIS